MKPIVLALLLFVLLASTVFAESPTDRMQVLIAAHPGMTCDATCASNWLASNLWLTGLARENHLDKNVAAHANALFRYDSGLRFENLYQHPWNEYEMAATYYADANAFADYLGIAKPFKLEIVHSEPILISHQALIGRACTTGVCDWIITWEIPGEPRVWAEDIQPRLREEYKIKGEF